LNRNQRKERKQYVKKELSFIKFEIIGKGTKNLKIIIKLYKENFTGMNYLLSPLGSNRGDLSSRSSLGIFKRLPSFSTFRNNLEPWGWGTIIKIKNPHGIGHLFSPQVGQTLDGLNSAGDVLDVYLVEVHF
jgi:hypothetical protein